MTDIVEEERVLIHADGYEAPVGVSRVATGRYRIEDAMSFAKFAFMLDEVEEGPEAAMGWLLKVEELDDGRLRLLEAGPDPDVEYVSGAVLPGGFHTSPDFSTLTSTIMELGGNWELFAWGLFSCYVPRDAAEQAGFDVHSELKAAADRWPTSDGGDGPAVIACPSCAQRMWVPVNKGLLRVRCRRCEHRFYYPPVRRDVED